MKFLSFAKINLHLEVLGRREDGFHELRTVFQTVDLADEIDLAVHRDGVELTIEGAPDLAADPTNLAFRAAEAYLARWGQRGEGVSIRLKKRIPRGGGLGGGSSNAATVLAGMAVLLGRNPGGAALAELAAELGSDVPFFLYGGTALGTGRGERIAPLPDPPAPPLEIWLAVPPVAAATARVFAAHRLAAKRPGLAATPVGAPPGDGPQAAIAPAWAALVGRNDLEPTCMALYPPVRTVYNRLSESGAVAVRLSGSGSTIFALFADGAAGLAAGDRLDNDTIWMPVRTLSRFEWRRRSGLGVLSGGS